MKLVKDFFMQSIITKKKKKKERNGHKLNNLESTEQLTL